MCILEAQSLVPRCAVQGPQPMQAHCLQAWAAEPALVSIPPKGSGSAGPEAPSALRLQPWHKQSHQRAGDSWAFHQGWSFAPPHFPLRPGVVAAVTRQTGLWEGGITQRQGPQDEFIIWATSGPSAAPTVSNAPASVWMPPVRPCPHPLCCLLTPFLPHTPALCCRWSSCLVGFRRLLMPPTPRHPSQGQPYPHSLLSRHPATFPGVHWPLQ